MKTIKFCSLIFCLAAIWPAASSIPAAQPDEARTVLDKYVQHNGGSTNIGAIKTAVVKASLRERNQDLDVELQIQAPDKVLFSLSAPNGMSIRMGFSSDGIGWRDEGNGIRGFDGEMAVGMYRLFLGLMPQYFLRLQTNACLEKAAVEAIKEAKVLKLAPEGSKPMDLQFDAATGALLAVDKHRYSDFRNIQGIQAPFSLRDPQGFEFKIKVIQWNAALNDTDFQSDAWKKTTAMPENPYQTLLSKPGQLEIVRKPAPMRLRRGPITALPKYDPGQGAFSVDLRGSECSKLALGVEQLNDLFHASFDSRTRWPAALPDGFDPSKQMELGRNPGLGLRTVHKTGITGKGIGIGIIDQTLLVDHQEYRDRLKLYEEIHNSTDASFASMHGPAVASIAVGNSTGVAPESSLYYIAETHGTTSKEGKFEWDFTWVAKSIDRLLEVNRNLPADQKIRVLSISVGWSAGQKGFEEVNEAVKRAAADRVFVISTSIRATHRLEFHGLGRQPLQDPDSFSSYSAGSWWAEGFFSGRQKLDPKTHLLAPMDARCVASPTGADEYAYYAEGGWSWTVPYIAGLYALACQACDTITPEEFWSKAIATGKTLTIENKGSKHLLGSIVDPPALIAAIRKIKP